MGDELLIRPATASDTDGILDLLKLSLGEGSIPRDERYWSWKHNDNPFGSSPALVAEAAGRLVGLRVFMRWTWEQQRKEVRSVRAVDTATHPDWQGKGIFTRLTLALVDRMKEEGVSFVFNTPNRFSRPGYLKMGWSSVGRTSLWVRPHRPLRLVRALLTRGEQIAADSSDETRVEGYSVDENLGRPELERLLESRQRDARLSTRISRSYLRWRYADIPGFTYRAAASWEEGAEAMIIFRLRTRRGLTELRLCEILARPERGSISRATTLIRETIHSTRPDYTAAMAAPGTSERRALLAAGFLPAPRLGPVLTVRPLGGVEDGAGLAIRSRWRVSIGDLELF